MSSHRVLILGARRRNQGLGEFLARYFHELGANVCGIVGTSTDSVKEAANHLDTQYGISTKGYRNLTEAIRGSQPTVMVIASPNQFHLEHLQVAAKYKLNCLCEKPLFWKNHEPFDQSEVETVVNRFHRNGKLLRLVTQWPCTLDDFFAMYPDVKNEPLQQLSMLLGPVTSGIHMVIDAMPHVLSMIHSLVGVGSVKNVSARQEDKERLKVYFGYRHAKGHLTVEVILVQSLKSPRPAGYALNSSLVWRTIRTRDYQMFFAGDSGERVAVKDPLKKLVRQFLADLESGQPTDRERLIASMTDLNDIVGKLKL